MTFTHKMVLGTVVYVVLLFLVGLAAYRLTDAATDDCVAALLTDRFV